MEAVTRPAGILAPLKIYYVHPRLAGPVTAWSALLAAAADMGFTHIGCAPIFAADESGDLFLTDDYEAPNRYSASPGRPDGVIAKLASACADHGLKLVLDVVLDRVAAEGSFSRSAAKWLMPGAERETAVDPRVPRVLLDSALFRFRGARIAKEVSDWWIDRLVRLAQAGAAGVRMLGAESLPATRFPPSCRGCGSRPKGSLFSRGPPGCRGRDSPPCPKPRWMPSSPRFPGGMAAQAGLPRNSRSCAASRPSSAWPRRRSATGWPIAPARARSAGPTGARYVALRPRGTGCCADGI